MSATENESVVYFIQAGDDRGPIKVGHTSHLDSRLASFRTASPHSLTLLATEPGGQVREHELHLKFHDLRTVGEWFSPAPRLVDYVRSLLPKTVSRLVRSGGTDGEALDQSFVSFDGDAKRLRFWTTVDFHEADAREYRRLRSAQNSYAEWRQDYELVLSRVAKHGWLEHAVTAGAFDVDDLDAANQKPVAS